MSWRPGILKTMKRLRKLAATMLVAAMLVGIERGSTLAQDAPPDLGMLMNLDLFEPRHKVAEGATAPPASPSDDSMLEQIRTLDAMGYLGNHDDADANDLPAPALSEGAEEAAPPTAPAQIPSSQPSYDVEGPLP
jgi:hypothetical protein